MEGSQRRPRFEECCSSDRKRMRAESNDDLKGVDYDSHDETGQRTRASDRSIERSFSEDHRAASEGWTAASVLSVEDLLGVPSAVLFRCTGSGGGYAAAASAAGATGGAANSSRPLLSRSEAQCLLRVRLLAQELDSLVLESSRALERRWHCRQWKRRLGESSSTTTPLPPGLRSLFSLLHTLGEHAPVQALRRVQQRLEQVALDLMQEAAALRQSSEQNWAVYESFGGDAAEVLGPSSTSAAFQVSLDKKRLSDLQDECCHRIEALLQRSDESEQDSFPVGATSLKEYCRTLWDDCDGTAVVVSDGGERAPQDAPPLGRTVVVEWPALQVPSTPQSTPPPPSPPQAAAHVFVYSEEDPATGSATTLPRGSAPEASSLSPPPSHSSWGEAVVPSEEKENSQQRLRMNLVQELMDAAAQSSPARAEIAPASSSPPACQFGNLEVPSSKGTTLHPAPDNTSAGGAGPSSQAAAAHVLASLACATAPSSGGRGRL